MKKLYLLIFVLLLFTGCNKSGGAGTPSSLIKEFIISVKEKNTDKAWELLSKDSKRIYDLNAKGLNLSGKRLFEKYMFESKPLGILNESFDILEEKLDGDNATVVVKTKSGTNLNLLTVKEDGYWFLDYTKTEQQNIEEPEQ